MTGEPPHVDYLRGYLQIAPVARALWRAIEAKHLAAQELPAPLLDLGCGFGEFAAVFFDAPVDAGVDIRRADLRRAARGGRHRLLALADARRLPFAEGSFGSVICISVLEHIRRVEEAVAEAHRVLRPGGLFVFTTPTPRLNEFLLYSRILRRLRLSPLSRLYAAVRNRVLHHVTLLGRESWLELLERAGFRVERQQMTHGRRAVAAFDLTLPLALPSQIFRLRPAGREIKRPRWLVSFWERRLAGYVEEEADDGCNLFVVARKL